jgi:hypothetical protein
VRRGRGGCLVSVGRGSRRVDVVGARAFSLSLGRSAASGSLLEVLYLNLVLHSVSKVLDSHASSMSHMVALRLDITLEV